MSSLPRLIVIAGPTASGKSKLAIELAQHFNTEILSCDSRQLYKELGIAVAKPNDQELELVKHHFINHISIHEPYNAGQYELEANELLIELFKEKEVVIMAGGTGLYIQACLDGFDALPKANEELRAELKNLMNTKGSEKLVQRLLSLDAKAGEYIQLDNPSRVMRAIEIIEGGVELKQLKKEKKKRLYRTEKFCLNWERPQLYERINTRVDQMLQDGLIEEAKDLFSHKDLKALQTVGYNELFRHFDGEISLKKSIELIKQNTRRYAKRQLTWFRRDPKFKWVNPKKDAILNHIIR